MNRSTPPASKRPALVLAGVAVATALFVPPLVARAQQGVGARAGSALDNAGRGIRRGVTNAFPRARASVHDQEVLARVYSRLHWDKVLVGSTLEIEEQDGGVTVLRGAVVDDAARNRAVILARDTVGVTEVVDEMTLLPPTRVIVTPAVGSTTTTTVTPSGAAIESTTTSTIKKP